MPRKPQYVADGFQQLPLFKPKSNWVRPTELPDLRSYTEIGLDTETHDEGLAAGRGPGWVRHAGNIVGVSVAWGGTGSPGQRIDQLYDSSTALYFPIAHPDTDNFDRDAIIRWLMDHRHLLWVMQNASYDLGWLKTDFGIDPPALVDDITGMSVMLDEYELEYSLDAISKRNGVSGKDSTLLNEALTNWFGPKAGKGSLWQLPAAYVGDYAAQDALATLQCARIMRPRLIEDQVMDAYQLEMDLIPLTIAMQIKGIRIDLDRAVQVKQELLQKRDLVFAELSDKLGKRVTITEIGKTSWLKYNFDAENIEYPYTEKGAPSFTAGSTGWMHKHPHWLPRLIVKADRYNNAASKFIQNFIIDYTHRGRIHASINQFMYDDDGGKRRGARTFRFSYSDPALQQMPNRDEELMALIRGCFLPEPGELWGRVDYEQQEFRLMVHFAYLKKLDRSDNAVERYLSDPNTDFHQFVADITKLERKPAKDANFAKAYGAGGDKFALMTNMSKEEAEKVMKQYDEELPFVSQLHDVCKNLANSRGWVRLLDGARVHFPFYDGPWLEKEACADAIRAGHKLTPCRLEEATERQANASHPWHGKRLRRFDTRTAMNSLIQGSAARMTKLAMRDCWREGIVPLLQVHDELNNSFATEAEGERMAEIMRNAVKLSIPMGADVEWGVNWGKAKKVKDKYGATWKEASNEQK